MRDYGKIYVSFWTSQKTRALSDDGKLLALYLLSCPHSNMLGCFRIPNGYVCDDLNWDQERVSKGFEELFQKGFATREKTLLWVVIHNFLEWNEIENPNQAKNALKLFEQIPNESAAKPLVAGCISRFAKWVDGDSLRPFLNNQETVPKPFPNPFETVSKPFRNQEQEQEQEQEPEQEQEQDFLARSREASPSAELVEEPPPKPKVFLKIPLVGNSGEFPITEAMVDDWREAFPAVDVQQALRDCRQWNLANPRRRKTKAGILRHVTRWLSNKQDKGGIYATPFANPNGSPLVSKARQREIANRAVLAEFAAQDAVKPPELGAGFGRAYDAHSEPGIDAGQGADLERGPERPER